MNDDEKQKLIEDFEKAISEIRVLACKDCYYCDKRNKKTESYCAKTDREDDALVDLESSPEWCPRKNGEGE